MSFRTKLKLFPFKMSSKSARLLARELRCTRVYPDRNYHHYKNHIVVNWGNSTVPFWYNPERIVMNHPYKVRNAVNKLTCFTTWAQDNVFHSYPDFTQYKETATDWIEQGHKVVCRTVLTGHSGKGIVIASTVDELVDAPLYTKFVKKDKEYRVHVFRDEVIDFTLKRKRAGHEGGVSGIRNHANGWVFTRQGVELPERIRITAIQAVKSLGLDFGAMDICLDTEGNPVAFEVNTAPGLEGTTLQKYKEAFNALLCL